ncbi:MAG: signal peptide peptidase SppA [Chloroflexi bacterium]|nr:signal peptide peptidase SppA [Chloroflexota bacterium]
MTEDIEEIVEMAPIDGRSAETQPQLIEIKTDGSGRNPLWVLLAVTIGFMLPVCACATLFMTSMFSMAFLGAAAPTTSSGGFGDAVAVVRVEGIITHGDETQVTTGAVSGTVIGDLRAAAADDSIKAILLRVDSPGGTVTGSAQIYEVIQEIEKPIIVSMAGTAASGGYYVSAPADYIFARPDTTTGSLGVVLTLYNMQELIENLGVDITSVVSGPNKTIGSPWETLTAEQQTILQTSVDESYIEFVRIIVDGRGLPEEDVLLLADGRIYSGRQALETGLVDELGNFNDAVAKAADMGGISGQPRIVEYEHIPGFGDLLSGFSSRMNRSEAEQAMELISDFTAPRLEYRYIGPGGN